MMSRLGLPAFPAFFIFPNDIEFESANYSSSNPYFCNSDSITFKISNVGSVQSTSWFFAPVNDPYSNIPNSTSNEYKIPPPVSGTYKILSVVDYSCFVDSIIDTITVNALPTLNLGPDIDSCTNNNVTVDGSSNTGVNYLWNDASTSATKSFSNTGQYSIQVTDALGCQNFDTINITINPVPNAGFVAAPVCLNNVSTFNNQSTISSGSITSNLWDFDNNNNSSDLNPSQLFINDGSYNVQLITTSDNGCKDTVTNNYIVLPIPTANAGPDTTLNCQINSIILDGSASSNGSNFSFEWTTNNGIMISSTTDDSVTINHTGVYKLTVTNNTNNCFVSDSVSVIVDTLKPDFEIGSDTLVTCENPEINLNATNNQAGNFNYSWTTNQGNIISGINYLSPQINSPGIYYLSVQNTINQCSNIDSINIGIDTLKPIIMLSPDTLIDCYNPFISLSAVGSSTGNYSYLWTTLDGNIISGNSTLIPEINEPGTYLFEITDNYSGCKSTDEIIIDQLTDVSSSIIFNGSSDSSFSIFSFDENLISYTGSLGPIQWTIDNNSIDNDSVFTYSFVESGSHEIIINLTNVSNGCSTSDTTFILVTHRLSIPGVISPNADGFNDLFIIRALENYEDHSLTIFNRWGEPVFSESPYTNSWGGQVNSNNILLGSEVVDGTYFYILSLVDKGEESVYKGSIEVKRK